jgi:hypothetical protein
MRLGFYFGLFFLFIIIIFYFLFFAVQKTCHHSILHPVTMDGNKISGKIINR